MFDNRNQPQPTMFGQQQSQPQMQQQTQQQQYQQQQQQFGQQDGVLPPQYQGTDMYLQQSAQRSPPKMNNQQGIQQSIQQPQNNYVVSPQPPLQSSQAVFEHKVITSGHVQPVGIPFGIRAIPSNGKMSFWVDWCIYIIPILFFIAILAFMGIIIAQKNREFDSAPVNNILKTLSTNQNLTPIADLVTPRVPTPASMREHFEHKQVIRECPEGFSIATLGEWSGINSGCVCDSQVKDEGFCWARRGCDSIGAQSSRTIQSWNGGRVCISLKTGWQKPSSSGCSDSYKLCGNVCVENAHECPLSNLIEITEDPTTLPDPLSADIQSVKIGSKWFRKEYDGIPIVQFSVVPGIGDVAQSSAPCLNDITTPAFESQKSYPLLKKPSTGCDSFGDLSTEKIKVDTQKAIKIQDENGITPILNAIPQYQAYQVESDSYTLEAIKRISVNSNPACQGISPSDVDQMVEDSGDIYRYRVWFSIIIFWLCVVSLVIALVFYLVKNRIFQSMNVQNIRQPKFLILLAVIIALLCIIFGALYFYNVSGDNGLRNLDTTFSSYLDNKCFSDKGITQSIESLHKFTQSQFTSINLWISWAFWVSIAFLVLLIILIIVQKGTHGDLLANPWTQKIIPNYQGFQ